MQVQNSTSRTSPNSKLECKSLSDIPLLMSPEALLKPAFRLTSSELSITSKLLLLSRTESSPFVGSSLLLPMIKSEVDTAAALFDTFSTSLAG